MLAKEELHRYSKQIEESRKERDGLLSEIQTLKDKKDGLNGEILTAKKGITVLETKKTELEQEITGINNTLSTKRITSQAELDAINKVIDSFNGQISVIEFRKKQLEKEIKEKEDILTNLPLLKAQQSELNKDISKKKTELKNLTDKIQGDTENIAIKQRDIDDKEQDLKNRIEKQDTREEIFKQNVKKLEFYHNRINNWYKAKGLKPIEIKQWQE